MKAHGRTATQTAAHSAHMTNRGFDSRRLHHLNPASVAGFSF